MLGWDPIYGYPASKETRLKVQLAPTDYSWGETSKSCTAKGFLGPIPAWLASQGLCKTEFKTVYCEGIGWKLDGQELCA